MNYSVFWLISPQNVLLYCECHAVIVVGNDRRFHFCIPDDGDAVINQLVGTSCLEPELYACMIQT